MINLKNKKIYWDGGQAMMVATMFFLVISITIIFGLVGPIVRQQKIATQLLTSRQSYFLAEAGVEDVVYRLSTNKIVGTTEVLSLNGESATTITTDTSEGKEIVATGDVRDAMRKVRAEIILGDGVAFHYGIQVGTGGFVLGSNAGVNGNVYANASLDGSNGAFITGSATAVDSINNIDIGTTGTGDAHAPSVTNSVIQGNLYCQTGSGNNKSCNTSVANPVAQPLPITDEQITDWKDEAALGGTIGTQVISGSANNLGPKKIQGNLTLPIGTKLTITGTLWITGNIVLSNNAELELSSAYGSGDGMIIVDGTTSFANGSTFAGSGAENSYIMLLSTNSGANAVDLSNNAAGAVIIYAPNGTVHLNNGAQVQQISAKTISLANNAVIDYEQGMADATFTSGPSGGYSISSWQEVE